MVREAVMSELIAIFCFPDGALPVFTCETATMLMSAFDAFRTPAQSPLSTHCGHQRPEGLGRTPIGLEALMTKVRCFAAFAVLFMVAGCATVATPASDEAVLRAVDQRERDIVAARDVAAMAGLAHPKLTINAPVNRVLTREQLLSRLRSGEIASERFERVPESVTITGDVGIVMGRETVMPARSSELGRIHGAVSLQRRYTNVYIRERGRWRWLARHANVVTRP